MFAVDATQMLHAGQADFPLCTCYVCTSSSKGLPAPWTSSACLDIVLITRGAESNVVTADHKGCRVRCGHSQILSKLAYPSQPMGGEPEYEYEGADMCHVVLQGT